jgi:tryptophan synthase alpha chain
VKQDLTRALRHPKGSTGLVSYLTAGYPDKAGFRDALRRIAEVSDVVEVGVPFSDPMADGVTIQESSRVALANGVSLRWILDELSSIQVEAPLVLFGYLNPFLSFGYERLAPCAATAGVGGFIVPDLPYEEAGPFIEAVGASELGLVQLVTPVTPAERARRLAAASGGFLYAVTRTGITGSAALPADLTVYLGGLRAASPVPVCAGFGIRTREHVRAIAPHADGVVVGSALVEVLGRREDPATYLRSLLD